ncbi:hypothetical protein [Bdellovibrio reynosensis]|uniref:Uncharacterized protein n=1 Tax=Bdellovibrio reynosensis TaxID=2835041 RepID=A0ABY4C928_9BACT|nr:hypothetical protein [Bdellovibrio reynosensis]UOF01491.1 hypothetical protein MNR06_00805 [Bdellovibrio reynosensis]
MQAIKSEAKKLIKDHLEELNATADELGGVFITGVDGAVAVIGAENSKKKIIFKTSFVSDSVNQLLDAQVLVQDLLEEEGIEAISEHDFNIAIGVV